MTVRNLIVLALLTPILTACATSPMETAEAYREQGEWMKTVFEYRKALKKEPGNVQYKLRLKQVELKAADHYYDAGLKLFKADNPDAAIIQYQQGLTAMPDNAKLLQAMGRALSKKESENLMREAARLMAAGKNKDATILYKRVLQVDPKNVAARQALAKLKKQQKSQDKYGLLLSSKKPITLNFRQTRLRTAFDFIGKSFGVNIIFDDTLKDIPVTLFAKDVTFRQALKLMLTTSQSFYKRIGPNSILIAPDTAAKRGQYEDYFVRTFQLNTVEAKEMAGILKGVINLKKVIINKELNTLVVRDTDESLRLVEKIIRLNDRKSAEMILDVEILEVSRSKAERLGLDLGYEIGAKFGSAPISSSLQTILQGGTLTLPAATFRFFKRDVDAKTLANPKIRVLSGKSAKIHIGDRIPLRAATIQDATGQVRTTYNYTDIGIRLSVEPKVHYDNSSTVKLALEVSTLGQNLGTTTEPAYSIGTRNAETYMLLRDGETAVMGGLIRDEDRNTKVSVPGLGAIPIIGMLFSSYEKVPERTDVLLTITPRVVRAWDLTPAKDRQFFSGTEKTYATESQFAYLDSPGKVNPKISTDSNSSTNLVAALPGGQPGISKNGVSRIVPVFSFASPVIETRSKQEFEVVLKARNIDGIANFPLDILFNSSLLSFVRAEPGAGVATIDAQEQHSKGLLRINLDYNKPHEGGGEMVLAKIILRAENPGVSYLVYRVPTLKSTKWEKVDAQVQASRVVIK